MENYKNKKFLINIDKEYILCAAIWYKDLTPPNPKKVSNELYLPVNISEGIVFCGHRHVHCLYQMVAIYGLYQSQAGEEIQGFLTNQNRFVDRNEAKKIAVLVHQLKKGVSVKGQLFSEDIY